MSIHDPQPGDIFFHAKFAGGCELRIRKRGIRKGWGDSIWVYFQPYNGTISRPLRILAIANWSGFSKDLSQDRPTEVLALAQRAKREAVES